MNKFLTAILAALMVAGGLSAISGATPIASRNAIIVGEGSSPLPVAAPCESACTDVGSPIHE